MSSSGVMFSCPLTYPPFLRMEGITSEVIHRLNFFAPGSLLESTREYRPLSLITIGCWSLPIGSRIVTPSSCNLSSSSTWSASAFRGLLYPSAVATSFPTNHGSPFTYTVRISPNSGLLKIISSFICTLLLIVIIFMFIRIFAFTRVSRQKKYLFAQFH